MQGYIIIARNYVTHKGEIDIVAKDKNEYVFIEVKTRSSKSFGTPAESINTNKKGHIVKSSEYFVHNNRLNNKYIRFDVIEVYFNNKNSFINHIKNVFL